MPATKKPQNPKKGKSALQKFDEMRKNRGERFGKVGGVPKKPVIQEESDQETTVSQNPLDEYYKQAEEKRLAKKKQEKVKPYEKKARLANAILEERRSNQSATQQNISNTSKLASETSISAQPMAFDPHKTMTLAESQEYQVKNKNGVVLNNYLKNYDANTNEKPFAHWPEQFNDIKNAQDALMSHMDKASNIRKNSPDYKKWAEEFVKLNDIYEKAQQPRTDDSKYVAHHIHKQKDYTEQEIKKMFEDFKNADKAKKPELARNINAYIAFALGHNFNLLSKQFPKSHQRIEEMLNEIKQTSIPARQQMQPNAPTQSTTLDFTHDNNMLAAEAKAEKRASDTVQLSASEYNAALDIAEKNQDKNKENKNRIQAEEKTRYSNSLDDKKISIQATTKQQAPRPQVQPNAPTQSSTQTEQESGRVNPSLQSQPRPQTYQIKSKNGIVLNDYLQNYDANTNEKPFASWPENFDKMTRIQNILENHMKKEPGLKKPSTEYDNWRARFTAFDQAHGNSQNTIRQYQEIYATKDLGRTDYTKQEVDKMFNDFKNASESEKPALAGKINNYIIATLIDNYRSIDTNTFAANHTKLLYESKTVPTYVVAPKQQIPAARASGANPQPTAFDPRKTMTAQEANKYLRNNPDFQNAVTNNKQYQAQSNAPAQSTTILDFTASNQEVVAEEKLEKLYNKITECLMEKVSNKSMSENDVFKKLIDSDQYRNVAHALTKEKHQDFEAIIKNGCKEIEQAQKQPKPTIAEKITNVFKKVFDKIKGVVLGQEEKDRQAGVKTDIKNKIWKNCDTIIANCMETVKELVPVALVKSAQKENERREQQGAVGKTTFSPPNVPSFTRKETKGYKI